MVEAVRGKLIVIEGTDGSGKETQAKLLLERLAAEGLKTGYADFPQHDLPSSFFVDKYLRGEYGGLAEVGPYKASLFFALDRFDKSFDIRNWLAEGRIVVCNRYLTANKGHQAGKIRDTRKVDEFLAWLDHLEYDLLDLPRQDLTVLLYAPPELGKRKVLEKQARNYLAGSKADIHESDSNHLNDAASAYLYVARKEGWSVLECATADGTELLPREEIHRKVYSLVRTVLDK